jgi:methanogenic corrinoid protein MtbC1
VSNHLGRLRELGLVEAVREGRHIYYTIISPDIVRALLTSPSGPSLTDEERSRRLAEIAPPFERAVLNQDHESARGLVDRALGDSLPWQDLYWRLFVPVLETVGDLWAKGEYSIDQEHAASQMIRSLMGHVAALRVPAGKPGSCDVLITCAEGERHEIGARMAADFLAADGLNVVFLGADTPNDAIISAMHRLHPAVVIVSATTAERAEGLRALSRRWAGECNNGNRPALMIGGRLTQNSPEIFAELGLSMLPADPAALCEAVRAAIE